jgi:hypothetical protein
MSSGGSESACNSVSSPLCHELGWCGVIEAGSGSVTELLGDVLDSLVTDQLEIGALGEVLAQQSVGVLVGPAPWRVRIGEKTLSSFDGTCGTLFRRSEHTWRPLIL